MVKYELWYYIAIGIGSMLIGLFASDLVLDILLVCIWVLVVNLLWPKHR